MPDIQSRPIVPDRGFRAALGDPKLPEKKAKIGKQIFACCVVNEGAEEDPLASQNESGGPQSGAGMERVRWYITNKSFSKAMAGIGGNEELASLPIRTSHGTIELSLGQ